MSIDFRKPLKRTLKVSVISLLSLILLTACSNNQLANISVEATPDCNRNMPVAMDILFIEDEGLAKLLTELSGPQWFERKQELMMRYKQKISLASFEIVPLSALPELSLPKDHKKADFILLFANYLGSDGQFVADLSGYKKLKIRFEKERYQLLELNE